MRVIVFLALLGICYGRPGDVSVDTQNVVNVPPNCPDGEEWINGQCREIWNLGKIIKNVVSVPPNCGAGQQLINGQCRDVWRSGVPPTNKVVAPSKCQSGLEFVNRFCRQLWASYERLLEHKVGSTSTSSHKLLKRKAEDNQNIVRQNMKVDRNIVSVPNQCSSGYKPDALGICRPVFD